MSKTKLTIDPQIASFSISHPGKDKIICSSQSRKSMILDTPFSFLNPPCPIDSTSFSYPFLSISNFIALAKVLHTSCLDN